MPGVRKPRGFVQRRAQKAQTNSSSSSSSDSALFSGSTRRANSFFMENWESTPVQFVQPVTNISGEDRAKVADDEVHSMLEKEQEVIGTRQLASVVGLLESTKQAILPRPLHFRALQQLLNFGIKKPGEFRLFKLKAASLALRSFVSADTQHVLLRLNNATAVAYVNHVGGTRSPDLAALALEMWSWALERGLTLSATHVPGLTNTLADRCSRFFSGQELGSAVPAAQQETPSAVARSDACRVAKIRRQLQGRGLSAGASDLILSAWRESTSRQYQSAWAHRPHRPVGSATLARWVKSVLGTAGVDTATFSAHSTRGASTSAATAAGVSLHSIMNAADWSRESTFLKYYMRDNNQHTFGQAVLSTALKSA
ncbi:hypothetical protein Bbelb_050920 [Branchiostoma belcheri]|nr:hypothetical protein Bbelb_050920 [Branchiostoma belcheri]